MWYLSALEAKHCLSNEQCAVNQPWGNRNFYQPSTVSILFAGSWHDAFAAGYENPASLLAYTQDATAQFLAPSPDHTTRIYCTASFWWTIIYHDQTADLCTGMTAI
jgi:hypothetical protein